MASHPHKTMLLPPPRDPMRKWALGVMAGWPVFYGLLALYLGADASWDLRNYHWYNAWAYLTGRVDSGIDLLPSQSQFFLNPWLDVPFYLLATHLPLKLVYFILGAVQGLNFPLLFMVAWLTLIIPKTKQKVAACAALAAMGALSAIGISEIGCVFYDNVTSIGILLSALLLLWRLDFLLTGDLKQALMRAAIFGLPIGLCVGLKMTCALFCVGECFALLVVSRVSRRGFLIAFAFGCGALLGYAATYGHWAWHLYSHYGSPTFPYFNKFFRSPLMPPVAIGDYFVTGLGFKLMYPFFLAVDPYLGNEVFWRDWRIPVLYVLLAAAAVKSLVQGTKTDGGPVSETKPGLFLVWMAASSYFAWISFEAVYRYLLPLDMLAPLLITICAGALPGNLRTRWQTAASALIVIIFTIQPGNWGRHKVWPEHIASVTPAIKAPGNTMVLMAGYDPYAYLLPALPQENAYVRIGSRAFHPDEKTGLNDLLHQTVEAHKGPLKFLMTARDMKTGQEALSDFHLALLPKTCQTVTDNLYEAQLDRPEEMNNAYPPAYSLCDVKRFASKSGK